MTKQAVSMNLCAAAFGMLLTLMPLHAPALPAAAPQASDCLPRITAVAFSVNMNGATTTDGHRFDANSGDTVWLNGEFIPWYAWYSPPEPAPGPSQYQLSEMQSGSGIYSATVNIPKGAPVAFQYKYGVGIASAGDLGPCDNEAPPGCNHFRVVRTTATGSYAMPPDTFGNPYQEPFFTAAALNDGQLTIGAPSAGNTPVTWLGRPGAHLQASTNLAANWQDLPQTDGTNWATGTNSSNGFVSRTNWPDRGTTFFRLTGPAGTLSSASATQDDLAFWSASGTWNIGRLTNNGTFQWTTNLGLAASYALIGDYNGDGYADLALVQQDSPYLYWYWNLNNAAGGWNRASTYTIFGLSTDLPCAGDFNGDGKTDIAIFRNGTWYIAYAPCPTNNFASASVSGGFGVAGDIPVPGDFNGDGVADLAVFRPSTATWYVSFSASNAPAFNGPYAINGVRFGLPGDIPAVGDIDGDGYADMIVYRPSTHQVLVNLHNPSKPLFQGYGDLNGFGSADLTFTYSNASPASVIFADVANARPKTAPLPAPSALGLSLPGWSCLFDNSLNVPQWVNAWSLMGINQVQFFSWMRAHEEVDPLGPNWNTWVGDERLWSSKTTMSNQIALLQAAGIKAMCYTALYAATPAFASEHPAWQMLDPTTDAPLDYPPGSGYLYLMCINPNASYPYVIAGNIYTNFRSYLLSQAAAAERQFNWDGWRWDWYGIPSNYVCEALSGTGVFPSELGGLVSDLNVTLKQVRSDCVMTVLELPNSYNNEPLNDSAAAVDQQFLELWPDGTGSNYSNVYQVINQAATSYADKPVSGNCYPQTSNFLTGWTGANIDYQFATCLAAGGYPGALLVDGTGSFTTTTPMSSVRYPNATLNRIAQWNCFAQAYGGYYYWSSPTYLIRNPILCAVSAASTPAGVVCKAKERRDKRTFQTDTVIVDLINYGATGDLCWDQVNSAPEPSTATLNVTVPPTLSLSGAYLISPDLGTNPPTALAMQCNGNTCTVTTPPFALFATVVFTTPCCPGLPATPAAPPTSFPTYPLQYDLAGTTLSGASNYWPVLDGLASPLELAINFDGCLSSWSFSTNAYYGAGNSDAHSVAVAPSQLLFTTTSEHAIRCAITNFSTVQMAVTADPATTKSWFGFRLFNPSTGQITNYYYRIGSDQTGLNYRLLGSYTTNKWQFVSVNLSNDVTQNASLGTRWSNAVVTGVILGPVAGGNAYYDACRFVSTAPE
jgi:hypothetical protein